MSAWIKVRTDLRDDPRVAQTADLLNQPDSMVVGCYVILWAYADTHSTNGRLRISPARVDRLVGVQGFAEAAQKVGWLGVDDDGMCIIPRFTTHNGTTAKKRCSDAKRQGKRRGNKSHDPSRDSHGVGVTQNGKVRELEQHQQQSKTLIADQSWEVKSLSGIAADAAPDVLLRAFGIGGRTLARLVDGGVTSKRIRELAAEMVGRDIRNPAGLMASSLSEEFKIRLGKNQIHPGDIKAIDSVARRRALLRGGA